MKTKDYDALIEERAPKPDDIARRQDAARLAELARNLESLGKLADAEAGERAARATPKDDGPRED